MEVDQEKVRLEKEAEELADQEMTPEVEARLVSVVVQGGRSFGGEEADIGGASINRQAGSQPACQQRARSHCFLIVPHALCVTCVLLSA